MRTGIRHCTLWLLVAGTPAARGGLLPSFVLERCAWNSTDIVIATEGEKIDGILEVVAAWHGHCAPGDQLILPELAAFASETSRLISEAFLFREIEDGGPTHVTGLRMVLFLRRSDAPESRPAGSGLHWKAAGLEMTVSCVWIERGQAYALLQVVNPGPTRLVALGLSDSQMKQQVLEVVQGRAEFNRAMAHNHVRDRTQALFEMAASRNTPFEDLKGDLGWLRLQVQGHAIEALGGCGEAAVPFLKRLWYSENFSGLYLTATRAIRQSSGDHAGRILVDMLSEELPFWRETLPTLHENWLSGRADRADKRRRELSLRAHRLSRLVEALADVQSPGCREIIGEVRALVAAMPEPDKSTYEGTVYRATCIRNCDRILESSE